MSKWTYLSYELSPTLSNYGGSSGIEIEWLRRMDKGDTSNNSALKLSAHTGTHIDYPLHFFKDGKTGSDYASHDLVYTSIGVLDISAEQVENFLIQPANMANCPVGEIEFLIIKTGFCNWRNEEKYWKFNWGFAPETAAYLKKKYPRLQAIGFDLISLSAYQQRETGRVAHKEFLEHHNILIVEDMDLNMVQDSQNIKTLIVAPLRFKGADGAPVTILAEMNDGN
jgi:kynurenine formamidase